MSTPISALRTQDQSSSSFPPHPQVQQAPNGNMYNQMQQQMHNQPYPPNGDNIKPVGESDTDKQDSQKELTFLFVIVFIISSEPVQRQLMNSFPALFNDSKSSMVANAINAGFICAVFYLLRNVKVEF